ncbi:hypothetical protein BJF90_16000 [Pseudonocardia sp. CNS-004]|nr:hypothetical protein BJF90_16000 [Pseudonocardia sp. CNS-004]
MPAERAAPDVPLGGTDSEPRARRSIGPAPIRIWRASRLPGLRGNRARTHLAGEFGLFGSQHLHRRHARVMRST